MTSFYLNHLFKDPLSKYTHIQRYWRLGLQRVNLKRHSAAHNRGLVRCPCLLLSCRGHALPRESHPPPAPRMLLCQMLFRHLIRRS